MKPSKLLVGLACLGVLAIATAELSAAPKKPSTEETIKAESDMLIAATTPADDQKQTLAEKFKAKQDALDNWDKTNAEKMTAAQAAVTAARGGTDADAKKKAGSDMKALQVERAQVAAEADKAIVAALTDDQKALWAGAQLATTTLGRYKRYKLTDEQVAKVKSACVLAAKEIGGVADDRKAKKEQSAIEKSLKWAIDNVIMTPEQREQMPKRAPKTAPAPEAPAPTETPAATESKPEGGK